MYALFFLYCVILPKSQLYIVFFWFSYLRVERTLGQGWLLLAVVQDCEGFGEACVFFVGGTEIGLVYFFEEGLVVFDGEPIISNDDVLDFEFIVYLLLATLVHLSEASNHQNILLYRWMQLPLEDTKRIPGAYKPIPILIIQLIRNQMTLPQIHQSKLLPQPLKFLEINIRFDLEEINEPFSEAFPKIERHIILKQILADQSC